MYEDDGSVRPAQPSFYETIPSCPPRRHSPQRHPFPCNSPPRRPCKISCHTCPCRSVDPNTHSVITGSSISLYGYCTPECNGSVSPHSRWVGTRRVALRYVSSSPPFSTVRATFTAHGAAPLVLLHGHP